jgi:hypothetical protein
MARDEKGRFIKVEVTTEPKVKPVLTAKMQRYGVLLTVPEIEIAKFPDGPLDPLLQDKKNEAVERAKIALQEHVENETGVDFHRGGDLLTSDDWEELVTQGFQGQGYRMVWLPHGWDGDPGLPSVAVLLEFGAKGQFS